jgi:hypothetical protein
MTLGEPAAGPKVTAASWLVEGSFCDESWKSVQEICPHGQWSVDEVVPSS